MSSASSITDASNLLFSLGAITLSEKLTRSHDVDSACSLLSSLTDLIFDDQEIMDLIKAKQATKENTVFEFLSDVNASNYLSFLENVYSLDGYEINNILTELDFFDKITIVEKEVVLSSSDKLILICASFSDDYEPFILGCRFNDDTFYNYDNEMKLSSIISNNLF